MTSNQQRRARAVKAVLVGLTLIGLFFLAATVYFSLEEAGMVEMKPNMIYACLMCEQRVERLLLEPTKPLDYPFGHCFKTKNLGGGRYSLDSYVDANLFEMEFRTRFTCEAQWLRGRKWRVEVEFRQ